MVRICALGFHVFCGWSVRRKWQVKRAVCLHTAAFSNISTWQQQHINEKNVMPAPLFMVPAWTEPCHSKDAGVWKPLLRQHNGSEHHGKEGKEEDFLARAIKQGGIKSKLHLDGCLWRPSISQEPQPMVWWRPQCSFCLTGAHQSSRNVESLAVDEWKGL